VKLQLLNFLLSSLDEADFEAVAPHLREVNLTSGQVLFEPGDATDVVYFPGSACVSMVTLMSDGRAVETSTVGRESAVALLEVLTAEATHLRIFAQIGGSAMSLPAAVFRRRYNESRTFSRLTMRHILANAIQAEQGVACNAVHEVQGRLARWLLMTEDRVGTNVFPLTQEYMAVMTGVQRSTVSLMAATLKRAGLIDYSRGTIKIVDRAALMSHACECYAVVKDQFEALKHRKGP
jgi:CRP-like cAMP-binding protein